MPDPSTLPEWVEHCRTQSDAWQAAAEHARLNAAQFRDNALGTLGDLARAVVSLDLLAELDWCPCCAGHPHEPGDVDLCWSCADRCSWAHGCCHPTREEPT